MNGRTAKLIRRLAREVTQGLPERRLLGLQSKDGRFTIAVNDAKSTRGVYRRLKKLGGAYARTQVANNS